MKPYHKLKAKRSIKSFLLLQAVIFLGLIYLFSDTIPKENHIDNVAKIIIHPREHIIKASKVSVETAKYTREELLCLSKNIFFEARGADVEEMIRVANVTLNRVKSNKYSSNVCSVVYESHQFSWTLERPNLQRIISKSSIEHKAWEDSIRIATAQLNNELPDLTQGSIFYHTHKVQPRWSKGDRKSVV